MNNTYRILEGVRVVDLTQGVCGPCCSMQLGDAGAEVVKVEPLEGDESRQVPPHVGNDSALFLSLNRNKKSLALDFNRPRGRDLLRQLISQTDIVVEDLGPGEAQRLGIGYEALRIANPKLVYCAISAFGEDGPLRHLPGAELVLQAMAEYPAALGRIGAEPVRLGADVANLNTASFATQAILGAFLHRLTSDCGQRVSVSMLGTLLHMRSVTWHALSNPDDWCGQQLDSYILPPDHGYQASDGALFFGLRRGDTEDWDRLMVTLKLEEHLLDPRFQNYGRLATAGGRYSSEVKPIWDTAFKALKAEEVIELVRSCGGEAVPIMDYPALVKHPQILANTPFVDVEHSTGHFTTVDNPALISDLETRPPSPPPALGQHTDEILTALNLSAEQIAALRIEGIIK